MEDVCYVCNQNTEQLQRDLTKIQSKHSKKLISELIERVINGDFSHRNVDDASNCICEGCLEGISKYDLIYDQVKQQEDELRKLLLSTETDLATKVEVKNEPPIDIYHDETVFVNKLVNGQQDFDEQTPSIDSSPSLEGTASMETIPAALPDTNSKPKEMLIRNNGKLMRVRVVKYINTLEDDSVIKKNESKDRKFIVLKLPTNKPSNKTATLPTVLNGALTPSVNPTGLQTTSTPMILPKNGIPRFVRSLPTSTSSTAAKTLNSSSTPNLAAKHYSKFRKQCHLCNDGVFYNKKAMTKHMRTHKKMCQKCDISFKHSNLFRSHMKWHDSHPGFTCRYCHYQLEDKDAYKAHLKLHEEKEPFSCVLCDKVFSFEQSLQRHVLIHGPADHLCEQCGKKFYNSSALNNHKGLHAEEPTVKCLYCPKLFKNRQAMFSHRKNHRTDRPFTCSICGMKFKRKDHMQVHEKRHTEDTKTEKCLFCPAAFEHKFYLRDHIKRRHGAEVPSGTTKTSEP
ncbi:zinc finger imprinted 3-like [Contarinia nasturtii]|uniref:zinc finger imprinted 3-like n=1 Tax=Contarinia nasturtii TaxID=265458 RepID=UPI0012D4BA37|nr:zinc finger imprinted 3-like [Contarinia nasturtii]